MDKLRLKPDGEDSLFQYAKKRMGIAELARRTGMTRAGLGLLLKGVTARPRFGNLENIAQELGLSFAYDAEGWYFFPFENVNGDSLADRPEVTSSVMAEDSALSG